MRTKNVLACVFALACCAIASACSPRPTGGDTGPPPPVIDVNTLAWKLDRAATGAADLARIDPTGKWGEVATVLNTAAVTMRTSAELMDGKPPGDVAREAIALAAEHLKGEYALYLYSGILILDVIGPEPTPTATFALAKTGADPPASASRRVLLASRRQ